MSNKTNIASLFVAIAAATTACSDPAPVPVRDSGFDVSDGADVMDVPADDGGTADVADAPETGPTQCGDTRFIRPMSGTVLGVADDADRNCSNGFAFDVQLSTNAPVGVNLELRVNGRVASTARVAGSVVTFSGVMLDTRGMSTLEVWQDGVMMACASASVSVTCDTPRCQIVTPMRSALNAADNTSPGMPFTTNFTVGTDIEDGREVELFVSNRTSSLRAAVMAGVAAFNNVPLSPDGTYRVRAVCTNRANNTGMSAEATFGVDNTPPTLEVSRPMANATIGVSSDSNATVDGVQYQVCGRTDATGQQFCASAGGAMPTCVTVASATADACVELTCPSGSAPFALDVTARDEAGNVTRRAVAGVHCQSSLPSVRIAAPAAYDPASPATILNASRDLDPATPGLQADVVACTDRMGGTASLFFNGATTPTGTPVAVMPTAMGDPCAMLGGGFVGIARFPRVTIPQTFPVVARTGVEPTGPTMEVSVTESGDTGRSAAVRLFVDSEPPAVTIASCGLTVIPGAAGTGTANIDVNSDVYPVTLTLTRTGSMPTTISLGAPSLPAGRGTFTGVVFQAGITNLALSATDPAGNSATTTNPCTVEVGNPPMLTFTLPTAGQVFSATSTTNITLRSDAPVGTAVTLTVNAGAPLTATVAAGGTVTFTSVMLPQGDAVALAATTAAVAGRGVGRASVTVVVDTQAPTAATTLTAVVPTTPAGARRAGTVHLAWTDGSDPAPSGTGTRAVARYEFRYSTIPLTVSNYLMAPVLAVTTTPGAPGAMNQADVAGLELEHDYYFAVRSVDRAGLFSPTATFTSVAARPALVRDTIVDAPVALGNAASGGFDVNGDGFADVVVGSGITAGSFGGIARVYFGSAAGITATNFTEFRGSPANRFGSSAVSLGDVNGDGLGDVAIGDPGPAALTALTAGAVHIFFGRRTWNAPVTPYTSAEADVTIGGGTGEFSPASLGFLVARVGDFNGDGLNDIAASAPQSNGHGAVIVVFGRMTFPRTITPNAADVIIRNTTAETFFGIYLAGGGRLVGGDTREDLLVGYGTPAGYGFVGVFAGRAAATPLSLTQTDAVLTRPGVMNSAMNFGQFIAAGVGDINGDGRSDLAIGTGVRGPGEVALYFGDASGGLMAGPLITSTSVQSADAFGIRMASIYNPTLLHPSLLVPMPSGADLLVGSAAYLGSNPTLYFYPSSATWTGQNTETARFKVVNTGAASQPINAVNWVGDVDNDGHVDAAFGRSGAGTLIILR